MIQVRKLNQLFRPVETHYTVRVARSPPRLIARGREAHDVVSRSSPHSHRDRPARDYYVNSHSNGHTVLLDERDYRIERREDASRRSERRVEAPRPIERREDASRRIERRGEAPGDLFLSERDYRAYGLQGSRSVIIPASQGSSRLDLYERSYERDHRQHVGYRDDALVRVETLRPDPPYLDGTNYQSYTRSTRHDFANDPYHHDAYHHGTSSRDSYIPKYQRGSSPRDSYIPPPLIREEIPSRSYFSGERALDEDLRRRETGQDRRYSTYAAEALSEYNKTRRYNGGRLDSARSPVSSRYSFAGTSYSYR